MKTITLFTLAAFLVLFAGCSDVSVEPIVAKNPAKVPPTFQRIELNDIIELIKPDESVEMVTLSGEITYQLTLVLAKTLPAKPVYTLQMAGRGEITLSAGLKKRNVAKPETFTFTGSLTSAVQESDEYIATFTLLGLEKSIGHVHLEFVAVEGQLVRSRTYADFHEMNAE